VGTTRLLILGASARAAAWSARRAGLEPLGIDLFGDRDLAALGGSLRVGAADYPGGLARAAGASPPGPWMYTGALENHAALVDRIASGRTLWGNPGAVLRRARDPFAVADALAGAGLPFARVWDDPAGLPRDGSVLVKPIASAAGRAIRPLGADGDPPPERVYYQERLSGPSFGAVFLARGPGGPVELAGLAEHWPGPGFAWRGCLGPIPADEGRRLALGRLGATFAAAFGLAGLFGVDLVERDGVLVPVEVNPRYTASVEVIERATGRSWMAGHRAAFEGGDVPEPPAAPTARPRVVGKLIVTAPGPAIAPALDGWGAVGDDGAVPRIADVPTEGTRFDAGEPVLTLLQASASLEACRASLARRLAAWEARLRRPPWAAPGEVGVG
jgi:predicted ATP-grasp superfamily ATP-dependent carboligase